MSAKGSALGIIILFAAGAAPAQDSLSEAAMRLKRDAVQHTLSECMAKRHDESVCKHFVEAVHKEELEVMARLAPAATDPKVNVEELSRQMLACYPPNYPGYPDVIECLSQLADRLAAAKQGRSLLKQPVGH